MEWASILDMRSFKRRLGFGDSRHLDRQKFCDLDLIGQSQKQLSHQDCAFEKVLASTDKRITINAGVKRPLLILNDDSERCRTVSRQEEGS
jgi:hypothetical protein